MSEENKDKKGFLNIFESIKKNKIVQYGLIFFILIALVLVIFLSFNGSSNNVNPQSNEEIYINSLENKLVNCLSKVDGVGKVNVVISMESGMETILAMKTTTTETSNGKEIVETPILVNGKTVVLKELYPKVKGVLIVCEGAKNLSVLTKIQQATVSLLDVNVNQIEILTMK